MKTFREWLYTHWLIALVSRGDQRALSRLKALSRLQARRRVREIMEQAALAESLGIDPARVYRFHLDLMLAEIREFVEP